MCLFWKAHRESNKMDTKYEAPSEWNESIPSWAEIEAYGCCLYLTLQSTLNNHRDGSELATHQCQEKALKTGAFSRKLEQVK